MVFGENVSQAAQFAISGSAEGGIIALSLAKSPQMTQLGRYAKIVRRQLDHYWLVQDIHFSAEPDDTRDTPTGRVLPVETHLFLESPEDETFARQLLDMGEQTCFLHALCRTPLDRHWSGYACGWAVSAQSP